MSGSTPARLLAPLALVVCAVALLIVLASSGGGGDDASPASSDATPAATATRMPTATATPSSPRSAAAGKTYTVKPGDSPSSIAAAAGVSVQDLLAANPDVSATALSVGTKLKVPAG